jgi:hypothetical protein
MICRDEEFKPLDAINVYRAHSGKSIGAKMAAGSR